MNSLNQLILQEREISNSYKNYLEDSNKKIEKLLIKKLMSDNKKSEIQVA